MLDKKQVKMNTAIHYFAHTQSSMSVMRPGQDT